jgi:hypothetical protein
LLELSRLIDLVMIPIVQSHRPVNEMARTDHA